MEQSITMRKVIAFGWINLSDHWASLGYLDAFQSDGYEVEYLNIDKVSLKQNQKIINESRSINQVVINSMREFEDIVRDFKNTAVFIPFITIVPTAWPFFKILMKYQAKTYYMHVGEIPYFGNDLNVINLKRKIRKLFSLAPIKKLVFNFQKRMMCSSLTAAFVAGSVAREIQSRNGCSNIIDISYRDYDLTVDETDNGEFCPVEDYWLFLDIYLPYHLDNFRANLEINPDKYYRSVNRFFDFIEKKFNTSVVIAAHPKSEYERIGNKFDGRTIIKGNTGFLVRNCKVVLNNESAALNFALGYRKGIFFITTDEIDKHNGWLSDYFRKLPELLGCPLINIDNSAEVKSMNPGMLSIDKAKRNEYLYKYLTSKKCESIKSSEIILSELRNSA